MLKNKSAVQKERHRPRAIWSYKAVPVINNHSDLSVVQIYNIKKRLSRVLVKFFTFFPKFTFFTLFTLFSGWGKKVNNGKMGKWGGVIEFDGIWWDSIGFDRIILFGPIQSYLIIFFPIQSYLILFNPIRQRQRPSSPTKKNAHFFNIPIFY